ncbi:MAG: chorismate mutase [Geodermatophilaceae bacterium]|nr:chorismate mutase [Geodermatophilaceae bacterium]
MTTPVDSRIDALRTDITAIDEQILALVARRVELSREVGALRMAAGGTRLSLAREQVVVDRFTAGLGADGTALAMLLLRAGRGRL